MTELMAKIKTRKHTDPLINAVEQAEKSVRAEGSTLHPQSSSQESADQDTGNSDGGS
jgi:hypothetical protein